MIKFNFDTEVFYKLTLSFWVCVVRHASSIQNQKFAFLCNISIKTWGMKLSFCLQKNKKVFNKFILSLQVCIATHTQSTKNNKFIIFLQCHKENAKDEVHVDKHQRFLQIDAIMLGVCDQACTSYPKKFWGIQLLCSHKMTRIWTPLHLCLHQFDFGNPPPANVKNFRSTHHPPLTKIVKGVIFIQFHNHWL